MELPGKAGSGCCCCRVLPGHPLTPWQIWAWQGKTQKGILPSLPISPFQGLCKITSQSRARCCINLRTPQTAGKPPKENNIRIIVLSTGHFLKSAPNFWWNLKTWVGTIHLSAADQLPLLLSPSPVLAPLTPHQVWTGILPPESAHWFPGSCWQEEGAGGRALCWSHALVCCALEHTESTWVYTAPNWNLATVLMP